MTFSQEDVDKIVQERLARVEAKYADYGDLKAAAEQLEKLQQANQREENRREQVLAEALNEAQRANAAVIRYKAAALHGVSGDNIELLPSGDEESVMAAAERLGALINAERELERIKAAREAAPVTGKAWPGGATPATGAPTKSEKQLAQEAAARYFK